MDSKSTGVERRQRSDAVGRDVEDVVGADNGGDLRARRGLAVADERHAFTPHQVKVADRQVARIRGGSPAAGLARPSAVSRRVVVLRLHRYRGRSRSGRHRARLQPGVQFAFDRRQERREEPFGESKRERKRDEDRIDLAIPGDVAERRAKHPHFGEPRDQGYAEPRRNRPEQRAEKQRRPGRAVVARHVRAQERPRHAAHQPARRAEQKQHFVLQHKGEHGDEEQRQVDHPHGLVVPLHEAGELGVAVVVQDRQRFGELLLQVVEQVLGSLFGAVLRAFHDLLQRDANAIGENDRRRGREHAQARLGGDRAFHDPRFRHEERDQLPFDFVQLVPRRNLAAAAPEQPLDPAEPILDPCVDFLQAIDQHLRLVRARRIRFQRNTRADVGQLRPQQLPVDMDDVVMAEGQQRRTVDQDGERHQRHRPSRRLAGDEVQGHPGIRRQGESLSSGRRTPIADNRGGIAIGNQSVEQKASVAIGLGVAHVGAATYRCHLPVAGESNRYAVSQISPRREDQPGDHARTSGQRTRSTGARGRLRARHSGKTYHRDHHAEEDTRSHSGLSGRRR